MWTASGTATVVTLAEQVTLINATVECSWNANELGDCFAGALRLFTTKSVAGVICSMLSKDN